MPHVIVKLAPGKTERQKSGLAEEITQAVIKHLGYGDEAVSVSMEEVPLGDWLKKSINRRSRKNLSSFIKNRATVQRTYKI